MRNILIGVCLFAHSLLYSQSVEVTEDYFKRGEFEKALIGYQQLYQQNPSNNTYFLQLIKTH